MALRRQRLSQRRKAVGLTQESLAQRLGVERSTVTRWEAGDTEPLPSVRPHVARALHVSVDQLAELLAESATAKTTRGLLAQTEVTMPMLVPKAQAEVWLGRTEFQDLIRPQAAEAVETLQSSGVGTDNLAATALGPALLGLAADIAYPADVNTAATDFGSDTPVPATVGVGRFGGSDVPKLAQTNVSNFSSVTTIPLKVAVADVQRRRARSRRFKRLAAAGVLALMGGIASMPFITSGSGRIPPAAAGNPAPAAPVVAIPASEPGSNDNSPRGQDSTGASVAAPNDPADGLALSGQSAVSTPHSTQSSNRRISASQPPASMMAPPAPRTPAIPAEAYTWSGMDALSARDQSRAHLRPESPPHP